MKENLKTEFSISTGGGYHTNEYMMRAMVKALNEANLSEEQREALHTSLRAQKGTLKVEETVTEKNGQKIRKLNIVPSVF